MQIPSVGHCVFALAIAGLGVVSLVTGHFASVWQPVPAHLPSREAMAHLNGILMLALGIGLLVKRAAGGVAIVLTVYLLLWFFLLHGPKVLSAPLAPNSWSPFGEDATLIAGGLILIFRYSGVGARLVRGETASNIPRIVFAFAAFLMCVINFAYPKANADFPPAWIPHWYGWGYLVGSAYVATGVAILFKVCPKLAAYSATTMMSLLTLLCWGSFVIEAPDNRIKWTGLLFGAALTGACWMIAESYRHEPWIQVPGLSRSDQRDMSARERQHVA